MSQVATQPRAGRKARRRAPVIVLAMLSLAMVAGGIWAGGGACLLKASPPWLGNTLADESFLIAAVVAAVSAAAFVVLGVMMWLAGRAGRQMRDPQTGAVILEFALVLPIALMLVLLMTQSALLMGGNLCVHYAAWCAARTAIVQVPTDRSSEPQNEVLDDGAKHRRIKLAAMWAVLPISCKSPDGPDGDAAELISGMDEFFTSYGQSTPGSLGQNLSRQIGYADEYTDVELDPPNNGDVYEAHEDIRVTVRHTFYMAVPYAAWLLASLVRDDGVELDFGSGEYGMVIHASCTLPNEGAADYIKIEQYPQEPPG